MTFAPGDRVHLAGIGTGIVREARRGGRYAIEIKGRTFVAVAADLEPTHPPAPSRTRLAAPSRTSPHLAAPGRTRLHPVAPGALDLHGKTVDEAVAAVEVWVNDALLAGHGEARVIHGRSGGRLKSAVHQYLRRLPTVASFRLDPQNPGVTIVTFA
jgi:hypothetical protein